MEEKKELSQEEKAEALAKGVTDSFKDQLADMKKELLGELDSKLADSKKESVLKVFVNADTKKDVNELTKEEKVKAYAHAMFRGDTNALKALSEGVNADGGFLVPQDFYNQLVIEREEIVSMRNEVTVVPMKTNVLTIPKHETGPEVYWTSEGETKATTTMDFSQPTITAYKLAAIIYMTDELMDDAAFSLTDVIVRKFAQKMAEAEERAIIAGTGVGQPTGIFVNATVPTIACTGNLDFDDLIDLIYTLPAKYRRGAKFIVHNNNVKELRKLKDNDGRYLWQDPVAAGQPSTIYSYPVIETYDCGEDEIAFGDYKEAYWLGDRQRMTVKITNDTETTFTKDMTAVRVVMRIGGDVIIPNAIRILNTIP